MKSKCGYVAIIGRPNVGKSTLLNRLIGQKISITSRKAQTTRHRILGVTTMNETQIVYIDTPGMHDKYSHTLNRYMNRVVQQVIRDVDILLFVTDGLYWNAEDELVSEHIKQAHCPVICVINKADKFKDKKVLLPQLALLEKKVAAAAYVPVSAKRSDNLVQLTAVITQHLPEGPHFFPADQVTDRSMSFLASELIREKLFRLTGQELPYSLTVTIEQFELQDNIYRIAGLILVAKPQHKEMVIGRKGQKLKEVGTQARLELERMLEHKVFLQLWVKVKPEWFNDDQLLHSLGYPE